MKTLTRLLAITLVSFATLTACGGGGGGGGGGGTTTPPPGVDQSPSGIWDGQGVTAANPDVTTSFEFSAIGPFPIGTTPFTATFSSGRAETRGVTAFYHSGLNAWHVIGLTSATVTFETLPKSLSFWVRKVVASDVSEIRIFDENSVLITPVITPTAIYQQFTVNRTAAETAIGSMVVTSTSANDVILDDLEFGYLSTTDDVDCVIAETLEFICVVTDTTKDALLAGAQGTVQVTGTTVTGSGTLVAAPGTMLADGSTVANLTISAGTVSEGSTLNLTIAAAGVSTVVETTFDTLYDRSSALATVDGNYSSFDLFGVGDLTSFSVNNGVITSASASTCMGIGLITIIDANFNAYDVTLDVTNCSAFNGMYDGLGLIQDAFVLDDNKLFSFGVFTTTSVILGEPTKP